MRTRSTTFSIRLLSALLLVASVAVPAMAQDESPEPSSSPTVIERLEEGRLERGAAREERKVERAVKRAEAKARREVAKAERAAERAAAREERKVSRAAKAEAWKGTKAAWKDAKAACREELRAVRADSGLDKDARAEAWKEAKEACRVALATVKASATGDPAIDQLYTDGAAGREGVVRTDLGIAEPGSAPGQELGLWHYLIPAGQELAPHTHPGWQLARITAGELEYTVLEGEGVLLRADGSSEPMGPGTYVLVTGDGVIENPELIHLGAVRTDAPVTLISATLFEADEPIATVVEDEE